MEAIARVQPQSGPEKISRAEATRVASQFEAIFVQQIVSKMREGADMLGEESMFGSGPGSDTYADWFDTYMSEHLAGTGRVGVADAIVRQLDELNQIETDGRAPQQRQEKVHAIA